jgi:putative membrane protein
MAKRSSIAGVLALTVVMVGAAAACSGDDTVVGVTEDAGAGDDGSGSDVGTSVDAATSADGESNDAAVEALADPQIAQVMLITSEGEIARGQLAQSYALTPAVLGFASQMVTEHTDMSKRQQALFLALGITASDSETSRQMQATSDSVLAQLQLLPNDFERVYIDSEVAAHALILDLIVRQLLPAATASELKDELQAMRATETQHLVAARALQTPP